EESFLYLFYSLLIYCLILSEDWRRIRLIKRSLTAYNPSSLALSLCVFLSVFLSHFLPFSFPLSPLSLSLSPSLCLSLFPSLSLPLSLSPVGWAVGVPWGAVPPFIPCVSHLFPSLSLSLSLFLSF